jgi:hypothetical protein
MNDNGDRTQSTPPVREEARPYEWSKLTLEQRQLLTLINGWAHDYVGIRPPEAPTGRSLLHRQLVDSWRASNILLIDGGRGSGKTSVMVTLLELWGKTLSGGDYGTLMRPGSGPPEEDGREQALAQLRQLEGFLLPVRILDLQPLPRSTSLLPWLAGRLLEVVEILEGSSGQPGEARTPSPIGRWEPDWEHELKSRRAWNELVQDAAAGWNGNVDERKATLDPEAYAVELGHAERARLRIHDRWRAFVSSVIEDAHRRHPSQIRKDARIVIPIDDADMNPHHCVALLDLLRALTHPQVIFLLTGDSELFLKTLHLHYEGTFRRQLGPESPSAEDKALLSARPSAKELAIQHYDKIIPRAQRFELKRLTPAERLDKLRGNLARFPVAQKTGPTLPPQNLEGYFTLNPFLKQGLPDVLRWLLDLQQQLNDKRQARDTEQALVKLWLDALEHESLSPSQQKSLEDLIQRDSAGELILQRRVELLPQTYELTLPHLRSMWSPLQLHGINGFTAKVGQDTLGRGDGFELSDRLTALLMLAHDFVQDERPTSPWGSFRYFIGNPFVQSLDPSERRARTRGIAQWPLPSWATFVDLTIFNSAWIQRVQQVSPQDEDPWGSLAAYFLVAACDISERRAVQPWEARIDWQPVADRLVESLQRLQRPDDELPWRHRSFKLWLTSTALLLASPEAELNSNSANSLLTALLGALERWDKAVRDQVLDSVRKLRREAGWFGRVDEKEGGIEKALAEFDQSHPEYLWGELVEGRSRPLAVATKDLESPLREIRVTRPSWSVLHGPSALKDYMDVFKLSLEGGFPEGRKTLHDQLKRLSSRDGTAPLAMTHLWDFFVDEAGGPSVMPPELRGAVSRIQTQLTVRLPEGLRNLLEDGTRLRADFLKTYSLKPGMQFQTWRVEDPAGAFPGQLGNALKLAHSVSMDEDDQSDAGADADRWPSEADRWTPPNASWIAPLPYVGTTVTFQGKEVTLDWPVPRWPSFLDWQLLDTTWRQCLASVENVTRGETGLEESILQALIFSLMAGTDSIIQERKPYEKVNLNLRVETWHSRAGEFRGRLQNSSLYGRRGIAIWRWLLVGVPLYAAPELGLSSHAARALLDVSKNIQFSTLEGRGPPRDSPQYRWFTSFDQHLHTMRLMRASRALERAGLGSDLLLAQAFLTEIDSKAGDHPWFKVLERPLQQPQQTKKPRKKPST